MNKVVTLEEVLEGDLLSRAIAYPVRSLVTEVLLAAQGHQV